ncbi:unnamed protein product [Effrenium voratum]|uniref:YdbS-like PH domain-containing protein n=1 Tax=Effrenium voratum TaxID=2562239 RepID=A0AA36JPJ4_9DINO|nr:unnamed protein product [Effrenium voratum]CAJ1409362.1 unnamed protein product [Effrenium voratum]CAJ1421294.1 unnamed protein product [Effrenium voratum]
MVPNARRRCVVLPALLFLAGSAFVGWQAAGRSYGTAMEAAKAKKQKQKMSLSEALERQKKEKETEKSKKEEAKLEAEEIFWEGPPSSTEMLAPFLSCFLVLGIIPFIAAVNRQFRVKYKITSQRVSVTGGLDGKDITEFSYQEIYEMKYGLRFFGYCADMRVNLRDGAKVELFGLLNFEDNYKYMLSRCGKDARKRSDPPPS